MKVYTKPEIDIAVMLPYSCIMDSDTSVIDDDPSGDPSGIGGGGDGDDPPVNLNSIWED